MKEQKSFKNEVATLYIVSTPIGNLKDITYRAVETLNSVDVILAEDTRTTSKLLNHYGINKKLISYHEYNKESREKEVINLLRENKAIALVSDAGTPGISDPGYEIIVSAINEGYNVVPIPGASAILASLVVSGLIIQPFIFLGFLPRKKGDLAELLDRYKYSRETLVIYESPFRIKATLDSIYSIIGNRKIALSRELTKINESIIRGDLADIKGRDLSEKGEYVLLIEGEEKDVTYNDLSIMDHYQKYIKQGYDEKEAMKMVSKDRKVPKSEIYKEIRIKK